MCRPCLVGTRGDDQTQVSVINVNTLGYNKLVMLVAIVLYVSALSSRYTRRREGSTKLRSL